MGHKIEAGYGIRDTGYGVKMSWRDRDELIQLVGCGIVLKLLVGFKQQVIGE